MNTSLFWNYAGSIVIYTLIAIGVIYAVFLYLKKNPNMLNHPMVRGYRGQGQGQPRFNPHSKSKEKSKKGFSNASILSFLGLNMTSNQKQIHSEETFSIESTLHLAPQKSLYVIQCDEERFLLSSSEHGIQLLTKLAQGLPLEETAPEEVKTEIKEVEKIEIKEAQNTENLEPLENTETITDTQSSTPVNAFHQHLYSHFSLLTQDIYPQPIPE